MRIWGFDVEVVGVWDVELGCEDDFAVCCVGAGVCDCA